MFEDLSLKQKSLILTRITFELIKNSYDKFEVDQLHKIVLEKEKQREQIIKKEVAKKPLKSVIHEMRTFPFRKPMVVPRSPEKKILRIPEPRLPARLQYLRPVRTTQEIDLGEKLNPFIRDMNVKSIECEGENQKLIVVGTMGRKPTGTSLSSEEIKKIFDIFSKATKIPIPEGITKMVFGKLILTAITSESMGDKFIIRKI
ncbi:hypothetical protein HOD29_04020 [archaeon]|mgnify:CR=1 FL=1|jgi:hypothetical protein|nr:hypothetical protein [archaeon]